MKSYRLVIRQQGRIVGHFDTTGEAALEDACVARSLFGLAGGYQCDLMVSDLSLIHISEPTRLHKVSRMPSSA